MRDAGREFILQSVTSRYRLWLLQPLRLPWEAPYVTGNTIVDNTDPAPLIEAARQVAEKQRMQRGALL